MFTATSTREFAMLSIATQGTPTFRGVTKPLQEYGVEQREKMIASCSKAASKGFKMANKAAQTSARAGICALHAFIKGSKSEGASDIYYK